ncbi:TPA: hypothetical protein ACH3X1_000959 [Trebouxia sp. C0004]
MAKLHGFQRKMLDHIKQGGSDFVVAPTSSGRTRVAEELSALWFARKSTARKSALANIVPLAH